VGVIASSCETVWAILITQHDAFGRDWRIQILPACDGLEPTESRVFGDVIFRSEPVAVGGGKRAANRR
jgi:hypothetical protein